MTLSAHKGTESGNFDELSCKLNFVDIVVFIETVSNNITYICFKMHQACHNVKLSGLHNHLLNV